MNKNLIIVRCSLNVLNEKDSNLIKRSSVWNVFRILEFKLNLYLIFSNVFIHNYEVDILLGIILKTKLQSIILKAVCHFLSLGFRPNEFHLHLSIPINLRKLDERLIVDYGSFDLGFLSINYDFKWLFARLRKTII